MSQLWFYYEARVVFKTINQLETQKKDSGRKFIKVKKSTTKAIDELNRSTVFVKTVELKQEGTNGRAFYQNFSGCWETSKRTSNLID